MKRIEAQSHTEGQCSPKLLINILEGHTQGEIIPVTLLELKKIKFFLSLEKNSSSSRKANQNTDTWWNWCSALKYQFHCGHHSQQRHGIQWAVGHRLSLPPPTRSIQVREGVWVNWVSTSESLSKLVSRNAPACLRAEECLLGLSCTEMQPCWFCYNSCYLHIMTPQVFGILGFGVQCSVEQDS